MRDTLQPPARSETGHSQHRIPGAVLAGDASEASAVLHHAPMSDSAFDGDAAFNRGGRERDAIGDHAEIEPLRAPAKCKRRAQPERRCMPLHAQGGQIDLCIQPVRLRLAQRATDG